MNYTIQLTYNATFTANVEANDEGEALDKCRTLAEQADMNEFILQDEQVGRVVNTTE